MNQYLKYAQAIQTVRLACEDRSLFDYDGFELNKYAGGCFECRFYDGDTAIVFAYIEERKDPTMWVSNQYSQSRIIYDPRCEYIRMPSTGKTIPLDKNNDELTDELTDEWYFQQSLLYTDEELKAITIFKVLRSTKSIYNYFSINTDYLEVVLKRMNRHDII